MDTEPDAVYGTLLQCMTGLLGQGELSYVALYVRAGGELLFLFLVCSSMLCFADLDLDLDMDMDMDIGTNVL